MTGPLRVALLPTCVVDTVAAEVGEAVVRVLRRAGCDVYVPDGVTCCGQPAWNAGFVEDRLDPGMIVAAFKEDLAAGLQ